MGLKEWLRKRASIGLTPEQLKVKIANQLGIRDDVLALPGVKDFLLNDKISGFFIGNVSDNSEVAGYLQRFKAEQLKDKGIKISRLKKGNDSEDIDAVLHIISSENKCSIMY